MSAPVFLISRSVGEAGVSNHLKGLVSYLKSVKMKFDNS